jgi:hypothetical protein
MRAVRSLVLGLACAVFVLATSAAHAVVNYTFAGKFTSNRGKIINIPMVGNTRCDNAFMPLTLMTGPGGPGLGMGGPGTMTPAVHPIVRGVNTQPTAKVTSMFNQMGNDLQCVKHAPNKILQTTGAGKGGAFVIPLKVWSKPAFKGYIRAEEVKYAPPVLQLATSFAVTGPASPLFRKAGGSMATGMNTAAVRAFKKGAFATQTGRAGKNFTWCPKTPLASGKGAPCAVNGAPEHLILKYKAGPNTFGGTMAYILTANPGVSNLAVGATGFGLPGAAAFFPLTGKGSQGTGRAYADFHTDYLAKGPIRKSAVRNNVYEGPILKTQKLITMVGISAGAIPKGTNFNWGFPFTTGTVLARKSTANGTSTITGRGYDHRNTPTPMGLKNISLVAGGLAVARLAGLGDTGTPEIANMLLTLPEPGSTVQLLAGVCGLLGIAVWRSRKVRSA